MAVINGLADGADVNMDCDVHFSEVAVRGSMGSSSDSVAVLESWWSTIDSGGVTWVSGWGTVVAVTGSSVTMVSTVVVTAVVSSVSTVSVTTVGSSATTLVLRLLAARLRLVGTVLPALVADLTVILGRRGAEDNVEHLVDVSLSRDVD